MRQMIDMPLQSLNLRYIVLLLLLQVLYCKRTPPHVLLQIQALLVGPVMVLSQLLNSILVPLIFHAGVPIILQNILFFHLQCPHSLLGQSFLILELLVLFFQEIVGLSGLGEFLVYEFIFFGEGLDVFG